MQAILKKGIDINEQEWDDFIGRSPQGALYHLSAFAKSVTPDWLAIEVREDEKLLAVMPLEIRKKYGFNYSFQPVFSQYWGVCFDASIYKNQYAENSKKEQILESLISAIPAEIKVSGWGFSHAFNYSLPFSWKGYTILTRYTYLLDVSLSDEKLFEGMRSSTRQEIQRAEKSGMKILKENSLASIRELISNPGEKQVLTNDLPDIFFRLGEKLLTDNRAFVLSIKNEKGKVDAAGFFAYYKGKTHYLMGQSSKNAPPGTMTFLLMNAFREARLQGSIFDFEGSMNKGIENFFRAFGGKPVPYLYIRKNALPLPLKWIAGFS